MTAKEVYEKMILKEIEPENALAFFRTRNQELFAKTLLSMKEINRPPTTDEQWRNMISPGSVGQQAVYEAKQKVDQIKADSFILNGYMKEAQNMIARQEKQPEITPVGQTAEQASKEAALEQGAQAGITNEDNEDNHAFMQIMKCEHPAAYTAMKNGLKAKIIEYKHKQGYFNFKCDKGCVGLVFNEAGYTAYKQIVRYIFINGEEAKEITLRNCKSNAEPKEWKKIKPFFFPIMPK